MGKKVMLLTLQTFSTTGGIQKMTRTLGYSLYQVALQNNWDFKLWSIYDSNHDLMPQYLPASNFKGFNTNLIKFTGQALKTGVKADMIIISHINMAIVALAIKTINPKCKIWLVAHGIEVWRPVSFIKKLFLKRCDKILCVSNFTKQEIIRWHKVDAAKCEVLNNAIDPFIKHPVTFTRPGYLLKRYGLTNDNRVLFTLTRLAAAEQYKGHEQVIKIISKLQVNFPNLKYILSGAYDAVEEAYIKQLIIHNKVENQVILTGFINEDELVDHFLLADLFVLPSKKEGFGIVLIEALICGLPVVCGNVDGSVDAIKNGELGTAVDPDNLDELENVLTQHLKNQLTVAARKNLQDKCLFYFNNNNYQNKLQYLLSEEFAS